MGLAQIVLICLVGHNVVILVTTLFLFIFATVYSLFYGEVPLFSDIIVHGFDITVILLTQVVATLAQIQYRLQPNLKRLSLMFPATHVLSMLQTKSNLSICSVPLQIKSHLLWQHPPHSCRPRFLHMTVLS